MGELREEVEFLVRSGTRVGILETLLGRESVPKRELRSELDVVRTTLQRNLNALEERDLIRADDGEYGITPAGELVAEDLLDVFETVRFATEVGPVLRRLVESAAEFDLDPRSLTDATVVESTTANPYAPVERHAATMAETDRARLVLPATGENPLGTAQSSVDEGAVHEAIVTKAVADRLRTNPSLRRRFEPMADSENVSVYVYDGDVPYYLGILDERVQFGVHDERGIPEALLESESDDVRRWAIDRFEAYLEDAERIA